MNEIASIVNDQFKVFQPYTAKDQILVKNMKTHSTTDKP